YYCSILPSPLQCTLAILGLKNSRGQKPDLKLSANELHANADNGQVSMLKQVLYPQDDANRMSVSVRRLVRNPRLRLHTLGLKSGLLIGAVLFAACNRTAPTVSGPLPQRGYLWQRDWTAAVNDAVLEAQKRMDGVVVL